MDNLEKGNSIGLDDLPENCISSILSFTTPLDVGRLALVAYKWRSAADSDVVWEKLLPHHYYQILSRAITPVPIFSSMKQLCLRLCQSVLIDNGTKTIWVDRSTSKVGCMLSARDLSIILGDYNDYWNWVSHEASRFEEVAKLNYVWWFEVKGRFECTLLSPNTRYRVSFVVKMDGNCCAPFSFSVDIVNGDNMARSLRAEESATPLIGAANGWMDFVAGEFFFEEKEGIPREIRFCMKNTDSTIIKRDIWIDGVRIEPVC